MVSESQGRLACGGPGSVPVAGKGAASVSGSLSEAMPLHPSLVVLLGATAEAQRKGDIRKRQGSWAGGLAKSRWPSTWGS